MKAKIEKWYCMGLWTQMMVQQAAQRGIITAEDAAEIVK